MATGAAPVVRQERIVAIDVLRGFALLGILVMNIVGYGLPDPAYTNPLHGGGFAGADRVAWTVSHLFFEFKMMTIFSALFGAGLVLMADRVEARGASPRNVYYRRLLWLLLIGLVHAYVVWWGDILVTYAQCGALVFLFRRRSARTLLATGVAFTLVATLTMFAFSFRMEKQRRHARAAEAALAAGRIPSVEDVKGAVAWQDMGRAMDPTPAQVREDAQVYRTAWRAIASKRVKVLVETQTIALLAFLVWRVGGTMIMGMGLLRLGVFSAERTPAFYARCMAVGYGLGVPLVAFGAWQLEKHAFDIVFVMRYGMIPNSFGSFLVAAGHVGLVMTAVQRGLWRGLQSRLAAVGQMALTNYLAHSLVFTTLFYGYGLNLFGRVSRAHLLLLVAAMWAVQLAWSRWWLRRYRFGPAEWLWRSLTYGRRQPMRVGAAEPVAA